MNTVYWILQIVLSLVFLAAGIAKLTQPLDRLKTRMKFVNDVPPTAVRVIGVLEVLGAVGIVLPGLTGVLPWLTPLAAVGLVLTMLGAILLNFSKGRYGEIGANVVLLLLALIVIYGRVAAMPLA